MTQEQLEKNKEEINSLISSITRSGARITELLDFLNNKSDFFTAPASTKFHNSCEGGLADHCLNVYHNLKKLVNTFDLSDRISEESIIISALLHDFSKINFYKPGAKNVKVYSPNGSKSDEFGKFDWVTERIFESRDEKDRILYGNHESTAEYLAHQYIPLTMEESTAILHHMGGKSYDSSQENLSGIYSRYPLATLLHLADCISTYIDESIYPVRSK